MEKTSNEEENVTITQMTEILKETDSILREMFSKADTTDILLFGLDFLSFTENMNKTIKLIIERDPDFKDAVKRAKKEIGELD